MPPKTRPPSPDRWPAIDDGRAADGRLSFRTRRQYTRRPGDPATMADLIHHY